MPSGRSCSHSSSARPPRREAGHPNTRCARSSTRSATWSARAAPGGCCPTTSRRPARCTGGLPSGPRMAPWPASTTCSRAGPRPGWPQADPDGGDCRLPIGAGGRHRAQDQPRVGCRQEGQWPQTPPGGGHPRAAAGGGGDRRQRPGPRRCPTPAVAAAGGPSRHPAGVGRCRVCRQAGRVGGVHAALGGGDRAEAPWPVDLRGAAAPLAGGADACLDQQASPRRPRLRAPARPSRRDGHLGHGRGDEPTSRSFPSTITNPDQPPTSRATRALTAGAASGRRRRAGAPGRRRLGGCGRGRPGRQRSRSWSACAAP